MALSTKTSIFFKGITRLEVCFGREAAPNNSVLNVGCGREATILILELRVSVGSFSEVRRNSLSVRCVPILLKNPKFTQAKMLFTP